MSSIVVSEINFREKAFGEFVMLVRYHMQYKSFHNIVMFKILMTYGI